jgi:hypothetical protein
MTTCEKRVAVPVAVHTGGGYRISDFCSSTIWRLSCCFTGRADRILNLRPFDPSYRNHVRTRVRVSGLRRSGRVLHGCGRLGTGTDTARFGSGWCQELVSGDRRTAPVATAVQVAHPRADRRIPCRRPSSLNRLYVVGRSSRVNDVVEDKVLAALHALGEVELTHWRWKRRRPIQ